MKKELLSALFMISLSAASLSCSAQASTKNLGEGHTPSISTDGRGHLFVVFEGVDNETGAADIYYSSSSDGGKTWTKRLDVSPTSGVSTRPRVAHEKNGAIDVVWTDRTRNENNPDIFFTRSTDSGHTWTAPINISQTPGASRDPELAIGQDDTIHVVFADTPDQAPARDIYYTYSSDGGKTWSKERQHPENVSNTPNDSSEPTIAIGADGIIHVAWKEENSSATEQPRILYARRNQNSWTTATVVSNPRQYSYHPAVACGSAGKIYLNWLERSSPEGAADIWCLSSKDNVLLPHPDKITKTASIATAAELEADQTDRVTVVWPDRALGLSPPRIRVKVLSNAPRASHHVIEVSHSSAVQLAPALAIDGDKLTVVWEERDLYKNPIKVKSINLPKVVPF